ncbi:MAG TPA: hypothetical protein VI758_11890 [Bacteroidota bacterium]
MVIRALKKAALLGIFCTTVSFSQQVGLSAKTDSTDYRIGDWIDLHVEGNVAPVVDTVAAAVKDSVGKFAILRIAREIDAPRWTIRLMTIDSGAMYVPPIPFEYRVKGDSAKHIAFTNAVFLNIRTIAIDPKSDIKDVKPPISAPWKFEDFIPYIIALVLLAGAGAGYLYYRKKRKERLASYVPPKPKIAPHTAALFALRELEDKKLWQNGNVKQYYSEATDIVRTFFEGRWNFIALELTTDEILQYMKRFSEAEVVWKEMQSFLVTADLVKFAKYVPTPEENENELRWAYEIVRAMTPSTATVEEEQTEVGANVR